MRVKFEGFGSHFWDDITATIAAGKHPPLADIVGALRLGKQVPDKVQHYIASLLDGSIVPSGRPTKGPIEKALIEAAGDMSIIAAIDSLKTKLGSSKLAIAAFAKQKHVSEDTVAQYLRHARQRRRLILKARDLNQ